MIEGSEKLNYRSARLADEIAHMKGKTPGFAPHWARSDLPDSLVVEGFTGREAINE